MPDGGDCPCNSVALTPLHNVQSLKQGPTWAQQGRMERELRQ